MMDFVALSPQAPAWGFSGECPEAGASGSDDRFIRITSAGLCESHVH